MANSLYVLFESVRLLSLRSVLKPDPDYELRKIFRWYSAHCFTPLHEVSELPLEDVLRTYYEAQYEEMDADALEEEISRLIETDEQRKQRIQIEEEEAADADDFARRVEQEEADKKPLESIKPLEDKPLGNIPTLEGTHMGLPSKLPEDVQIQFIDPDQFEQDIEGFGLMDQPIKKTT